MTVKRPSKRERVAMSLMGHGHSPPVNKRAIRKANLQRIAAGVKFAKSDTPSVIASAYAKSHAIRAFVPIHGTGNGTEKPRVTPADKRRFACETEKAWTVDKVKSKPGQRIKVKVVSRHKAPPAPYMGEYERKQRGNAHANTPLPDAEYQRIKGTLGLRK